MNKSLFALLVVFAIIGMTVAYPTAREQFSFPIPVPTFPIPTFPQEETQEVADLIQVLRELQMVLQKQQAQTQTFFGHLPPRNPIPPTVAIEPFLKEQTQKVADLIQILRKLQMALQKQQAQTQGVVLTQGVLS